ncbi:MAG TPA: hypothetical protein VN739_06265 [Nitrososphaerales archaeon]|nr:hypothetical protein [Nitrososphaerales archaeon]
MSSVEHTYREVAKFVSLALSVTPNTKTEGYLEEAWKLIETLPDKNRRGFRYTYPEIYEAITVGIRPTLIEAIRDELSELSLTTKEDVESIQKDVEGIEDEKK